MCREEKLSRQKPEFLAVCFFAVFFSLQVFKALKIKSVDALQCLLTGLGTSTSAEARECASQAHQQ